MPPLYSRCYVLKLTNVAVHGGRRSFERLAVLRLTFVWMRQQMVENKIGVPV